jgi:hypothetical protein
MRVYVIVCGEKDPDSTLKEIEGVYLDEAKVDKRAAALNGCSKWTRYWVETFDTAD